MKSITISNLKTELKSYAAEIRAMRIEYKELQREITKGYTSALSKKKWDMECAMWKVRYEFRHKHVAYCQLRGKTLDRIEPNSKSKPNQKYLDELMAQYLKALSAEKLAEPAHVAASP